MTLKISLGGRLEVEANGAPIDEERFQGRQGRLVFAYLVVEQDRPVPREELAEALWGESPPATWEKGLTVIVSRLRGVLTEGGLDGSQLLTSAFGCYRLDLPAGSWVDVLAAANGVEVAEQALAETDLERAAAEARASATLARRRFLPGEEGPWVDERRRELADVLTRSLGCLGDVLLRTGNFGEAVKYAEEAVELEPFRESGYRRLMEAHAAAGNGAEALRVYERCRKLLAEELGAYPSAETQAIYRELLRAGPTAQATPIPEAPSLEGRTRRRRWIPALVVALLAGTAAAIVVFGLSSGSPGPVAVLPNSVAVIDPHTDRVVASVPVGARPTAVLAGKDAVWVANGDDGTVSRIDPHTRTVVKTIGIGAPVIDLALGSGALWVANGTAGTVARVEPRVNAVTGTIDLRGPNPILPNSVYAVAAGNNAVWVAAGSRVLRLNGRTQSVSARIDTIEPPSTVAVGEGATWAGTDGERVLRIEPSTNAVTARAATALPVAIAAGEGGVWVATASGSIWRVDSETGAVAQTIPVGKQPLGIAAAGGAVWVANGRDGTVSRIDPNKNDVVATIKLGHTPSAVSVGAGFVWVTVQRERVT